MANQSINDFKAKLTGGGARNNLFKVTCNFPSYAGGDPEYASFMIKAASLPASNNQAISIAFRGRRLPVAGDRSFDPWQITIINDVDMKMRNAFERWANAINNNAENTGLSNPSDYMVDMAVEQLNKAGETTKKYDFRGCWPMHVGQIDLSSDAENTIEEFAVELAIVAWESAQSKI